MFGADYADALRFVGAPEQFAYVDSFTDDNGVGRGSRRIRLSNGSGFEIELLPDRGLDIGRASAWGTPIAWFSGVGFPAPGLVQHGGNSWLKSFGGGLLTTCGLDNFGPAVPDKVEHGLHGDYSGTPATLMVARRTDLTVVVEAEIRQGSALGGMLRLVRRVEMPLGVPVVTVTDVVENLGSTRSPYMLLYHCNFGWPLISPGAKVLIESAEVVPRDEPSAAGLGDWGDIGKPVTGASEQVFQHVFEPTGAAVARIDSPKTTLSVEVSWSRDTLPALFQWKLLGEHDYVVGLEPANCTTLGGRGVARELGLLPHIAPGKWRSHTVEIRLSRTTAQ